MRRIGLRVLCGVLLVALLPEITVIRSADAQQVCFSYDGLTSGECLGQAVLGRVKFTTSPQGESYICRSRNMA
jgi:hypothetical protein